MSVKRALRQVMAPALGLLLSGTACVGSIDQLDPTDDPPAVRPGDPGMPGGSGGGTGNNNGGGGNTATGPLTPPTWQSLPPTVRFARLTHKQWELTVRDLLGLPATPGLSRAFRESNGAGHFDNLSTTWSIDDTDRQNYRDAAEKLAADVTGNAAQLKALLPANMDGDMRANFERFVQAFGRRAYRRPLTPAEVTAHVTLMGEGTRLFPEVKDPLVAGVRLALEAFLQSPHFLYRTELGTQAVGGRIPLDAYEVASKLSYALTNSMPDEPLFAAAAAGKLKTREGVAAEADRLLASPAVAPMFTNFHEQLLKVRDYRSIEKDPKTFPLFPPEIVNDLQRETLAVVDEVLVKGGQPWAALFSTKHSHVNKRLAALYGVKGTFSDADLTRTAMPTEREGLLTFAGFNALKSSGKDGDIIHRGVYIAEYLMCKDMPPPIEGITLPMPDATRTNREIIDALTGKGTCGESCHMGFINPPGYAFENFDGIGAHRPTDKGRPVDTSSEYRFDNQVKRFADGIEFQKHLAASRELHDCYTKMWVSYLHGREAGELPHDKTAITDLGARLHTSRAPVRALVKAIVTSDPFLNRAP